MMPKALVSVDYYTTTRTRANGTGRFGGLNVVIPVERVTAEVIVEIGQIKFSILSSLSNVCLVTSNVVVI
jgi:hypothetical protein